MKILIMAGGGGTRLWPLSRTIRPKQFHPLVSKSSLFQMTYGRIIKIAGVHSQSDIYVSTNRRFRHVVMRQVRISPEHIIVEPVKRDNAAAIGLSLCMIDKQLHDRSEVIGMFPSDHIILNEPLFQQAVLAAATVAYDHVGSLVTIGIRPTFAHTGFGYIEMKKNSAYTDKTNKLDIYEVASFTEKPDKKRAERFIRSLRYLWNSGIYFFRIDTMLTLYENFLPDLYRGLLLIQKAIGTTKEKQVLDKVYPTLPETSLDYGISEKTKKVYVVPVDHLGWSDVGNFGEVWNNLSKDKSGNVIQGKQVVLHRCENSLFYSDKRIITGIGLKDIVVIDKGDVLLVTTKEESLRMKELLAILKEKGYDRLL